MMKVLIVTISSTFLLSWVALLSKLPLMDGFQTGARLARKVLSPQNATVSSVLLPPMMTALGYRKEFSKETTTQHPSSVFASPPSEALADGGRSRTRKGKRTVYKHLFRNYGDVSFDSWLRCQDPESFLRSVGYTPEEIEDMEKDFPALLSLKVHDQLSPKIRFIVETLGGGSGRLAWNIPADDAHQQGDYDPTNDPSDRGGYDQTHSVGRRQEEECSISSEAAEQEEAADAAPPVHSMRVSPSTRAAIPANFFGCQLDRVVGPFHAYLQLHKLPHGRALLEEPHLLDRFLRACDGGSPSSATTTTPLQCFVELCGDWGSSDKHGRGGGAFHHTRGSVEEFVTYFSSGLLPAARGLAGPWLDVDIIPIMLMLGANPLEYDRHGVTPLFYAAGSGNVEGFRSLAEITRMEHEYGSILETLEFERESKDGATAFHWACCGVRKDLIGGGGSLDICRWILGHAGEEEEAAANLVTWCSKSTPVMWAAWAGSLEIVHLLLSHGAKLDHVDSKGRNAFHWSAAAGHIDVVEYLMKQRGGVDAVNHVDHDGKRPVDYAGICHRDNVVKRIEELNADAVRTL